MGNLYTQVFPMMFSPRFPENRDFGDITCVYVCNHHGDTQEVRWEKGDKLRRFHLAWTNFDPKLFSICPVVSENLIQWVANQKKIKSFEERHQNTIQFTVAHIDFNL